MSFTGALRAVSNNARRRTFHRAITHIMGGCTRSFGGVGRSDSGLGNSSVLRNLITIISIGLTSTRFRDRAGTGLNGASVNRLIHSVMGSRLCGFLRRGPTRSGVVVSGTVTTSGTHRTTRGTESTSHGGSNVNNGAHVPRGLGSYVSSSTAGARVFVIRNSDTNNSTIRKEGDACRTVLPL